MSWQEILKKKKKYASKPVWKPMSKPKIVSINHREMNMDKYWGTILNKIRELEELLTRVDKMLEVAPKAIGLIDTKKLIQKELDDFNNMIDNGPITSLPDIDDLQHEVERMEEQ